MAITGAGSGEVASGPAPRVFINCPYDDDFEARRDALILACVGTGFYPTSAIVDGPGGKSRIDRIFDELDGSILSIHDLSRATGEGGENLARFNMPLELGMAMFLAHREPDRHAWVALVPDEVSRTKLVSDLNGFDPEVYDGTVGQLVHRVTSFLASQPAALPGSNPKLILDARPRFLTEKELLTGLWEEGLRWVDLVAAAQKAFPAAAGQSEEHA
jgi:hypothetical protein